MDFRDVGDLKLGVSRVNRSCAPHDLKMDGNLVVNRGRRMNDRLGDRNLDDDLHDQNLVVNRVNRNYVRRDQKMVLSLVVNRGHHMNDRLDDHLMDDGHRDVLVGHRTNVMDDLNLVVNRVNRNYVRRDQNLDASRANRNCDPHDLMTDVNLDDRKMGVKMDGNLYRHTNVTDDRNDLMMVVSLDVSRDLHMYDLLDDPNLDANRVNRNCVRHDQMTDVNLDAMSHRVKLTGDRSTSCDRMSRDHLQCDHQMMRHRDTNRMDVKNLDAMKMMNHRVNRRMMDDLKMVCLMKI